MGMKIPGNVYFPPPMFLDAIILTGITCSPFQLDYVHSATRDEVKAANVSITLDPVGKDDWKFNWAITFTFEDGPKIVTKEDGVELSAPQEVLTWPVISA
jgi:hypothetical protein